MLSFFRGWKRKMAVVSLGMACLFLAGWVRSLFVTDVVQIPFRGVQSTVQSIAGELALYCLWADHPDDMLADLRWSWASYQFEEQDSIDDQDRSFLQMLGFHYQYATIANQNFRTLGIRALYSREWTIPYWSIALPLAAISAWLLLSKQPPVKRAEIASTDESVCNVQDSMELQSLNG